MWIYALYSWSHRHEVLTMFSPCGWRWTVTEAEGRQSVWELYREPSNSSSSSSTVIEPLQYEYSALPAYISTDTFKAFKVKKNKIKKKRQHKILLITILKHTQAIWFTHCKPGLLPVTWHGCSKHLEHKKRKLIWCVFVNYRLNNGVLFRATLM